MVLRKDELEVKLKDDNQLIKDGVLKDDSPLDVSEEFQKLCVACRIGDLKACQEAISTGVNINARDLFDYTPLILVSFPPKYERFLLLNDTDANVHRQVSVDITKLSNYSWNPEPSANEIPSKESDAFIMP
jgi:ankyrin repeat/BTB/POZ domain-containing protein 1